MNRMLFASLALVAVTTSCAGGTTTPTTTTFKATLSGANQRPAVVSTGTGSVTATLDASTKVLTVTGSYEKLSGAVTAPGALASGAHIHGSATSDAETNAGVLFDLTVTPGAVTTGGTISGSATLSDVQVTQMNEGRYYVNLHTPANAAGEIRGQLLKQ